MGWSFAGIAARFGGLAPLQGFHEMNCKRGQGCLSSDKTTSILLVHLFSDSLCVGPRTTSPVLSCQLLLGVPVAVVESVTICYCDKVTMTVHVGGSRTVVSACPCAPSLPRLPSTVTPHYLLNNRGIASAFVGVAVLPYLASVLNACSSILTLDLLRCAAPVACLPPSYAHLSPAMPLPSPSVATRALVALRPSPSSHPVHPLCAQTQAERRE